MASEKRMVYAEDVATLINGLESLPWEEETDYLVESLTTVDAVEVVRCKACLSHEAEGCPKGKVWCKTICRYMKPDGYCSEGKRCDDA